jgi:hypothetical protein
MTHYYQVNYTLTEVPDDAAYFHAQFRRTNPLPYRQPYTIVDGIRGWSQYAGTPLTWGVNNIVSRCTAGTSWARCGSKSTCG